MELENWFLNHPKVRVLLLTSLTLLSVCTQLRQMQSYGLGNPSQMYAAMHTYLDLTEGGWTVRRGGGEV